MRPERTEDGLEERSRAVHVGLGDILGRADRVECKDFALERLEDPLVEGDEVANLRSRSEVWHVS